MMTRVTKTWMLAFFVMCVLTRKRIPAPVTLAPTGPVAGVVTV